MTRLRVVFQNSTDTNGLIFTPVWFGLHDGNYDLFDEGSKAGLGLETIAEDGDASVLFDEFNENQSNGVTGLIRGPQQTDSSPTVFDPGEIAGNIIDVDATDNRYFTFASMVLPSNDAFIGAEDSLELFDENGQFLGAKNEVLFGEDIYDAGTEENREFDTPFIDPDEVPRVAGVAEDGVIAQHEGFLGSEGNPLQKGEEAFILGKNNIFGTPIDQEAADFTQENFRVGTVHINEIAEQSGTSTGDTIIGGSEDDFINALDGDDRIEGGAGWDVIDGGEGEDTYIVRASLTDYSAAQTVGGLNITNGTDDSDLLNNIEHIQFDDGVVHIFSDGSISANNEDVADNYVNVNLDNSSYSGTSQTDALVVNGVSSDYSISEGETERSFIVSSFDGRVSFSLSDYEYVVFNDSTVSLQASDETESESQPDNETNEETDNEAVLISDTVGETDFVNGDTTTDAFVIDGNAESFSWGQTQDGNGIVVWQDDNFDILYDVEQLRFNDQIINLSEMDEGEVQDVKGVAQHLVGGSSDDVFIIDANSTDYGWGATEDGTGVVVWSGEDFDVLNGFEEIQFNDTTIDLNADFG